MNRPRVALEDPDRVLHRPGLAEQQSAELVEGESEGALTVRLVLRVRPHRRPRVSEAPGVDAPSVHPVEADGTAVARRDYLRRDEPLPIRRLHDDKPGPSRKRVIAVARDHRAPVDRRSSRCPAMVQLSSRPKQLGHAVPPSIASTLFPIQPPPAATYESSHAINANVAGQCAVVG